MLIRRAGEIRRRHGVSGRVKPAIISGAYSGLLARPTERLSGWRSERAACQQVAIGEKKVSHFSGAGACT